VYNINIINLFHTLRTVVVVVVVGWSERQRTPTIAFAHHCRLEWASANSNHGHEIGMKWLEFTNAYSNLQNFQRNWM